jgi:hypothetical protein
VNITNYCCCLELDEANHRLFVGTRDPPNIIVFDTNLGKVVSAMNIANDADDIFYDSAKNASMYSVAKDS